MSDITKLTEKIIQDATKKEEQYIIESERSIERKEELKKRQLEKQVNELLTRFEKEIRAEISLEVSDLDVKSRAKLLAVKESVLDELFEESQLRLEQLSQEEFDQFVIANIEKTQLTDQAEIIIGENSESYASKSAIQKWQDALSNLTLTIAKKSIPRRNGFLIRQGDIEYNFTFEALLRSVKDEISHQLLDVIFEEE
ncbi:MAG TPA: V-type ATP synthase subunit E [Candidatus Tetragenococcus pullicola]|nr:V-type ATP synthase subunit E [Candidatus Tetragenococcus pullicola]